MLCIKCKKEKPASKFYKSKCTKSGRHSYCIVCHKVWNSNKYKKDKTKVLTANKRWADANPEKRRDIALRYSYGITLEDYDKMFAEQRGVCKICGADQKGSAGQLRLAVDHCHNTGKVRGLLCVSCNTTLGKIETNPSLLNNIRDYMEKYTNAS